MPTEQGASVDGVYLPPVIDKRYPRSDAAIGLIWLRRGIEKAVEAVSGSAGIDSSRMGAFQDTGGASAHI